MCNYYDGRMNLRVWACCLGMCRTHDTLTVRNCQDTLSDFEVQFLYSIYSIKFGYKMLI